MTERRSATDAQPGTFVPKRPQINTNPEKAREITAIKSEICESQRRGAPVVARRERKPNDASLKKWYLDFPASRELLSYSISIVLNPSEAERTR